MTARPRIYECTTCHHQESVTSGTILHRTRTALPKWFPAAYLMGCDKRGVSAKFLQRELGVAYQTAWTMTHKLRHGLTEDQNCPLSGFLEADETFIGGRDDPASPGRSTENPDKSLIVAVVEKVPAPKNKNGKHGHAVKRRHGFYAGNVRIAVLPAANAARFFPIIHTVFSNIKAWLVETHHGVSAKHLPRYLREWAYRFNRRNLKEGPAPYLIRRAVECATITYDQIVGGSMDGRADRQRRLPIPVEIPSLAG